MKIGLTGSIGMGKSTIAAIFAEYGVPVWDADAAVTLMYQSHLGLREFVAKHCPDAVNKAGIDKSIWRDYLRENPGIFPDLEKLIHGHIAVEKKAFLNGEDPFKLCDIPLLFETEQEDMFDKIIVVSAPYEIQRQRVLGRGEMDEAQFEAILSRQMPDEEKRERADYVIDTSRTLDETRREVYQLLESWGYQHA